MSNKYFDKFPTVRYSNNLVVDITKRVALLDKVSRNPYVFYNYDVSSEERPDQLSNRYYRDSYKSWLIYLTNDVVDPYHDWYMSETELLDFVILKYGSLFNAENKIKFYRNNWENQDPISKSEYNSLPFDLQKYWTPNYENSNQIINYVRKQADWSTTTNKIISYQVSNTSFIKDEICNIRLMGESLGKGQVVATNSDKVFLQHVYGDFYTSSTIEIDPETHVSYIYGTESNCNAVVTAVSSVSNNIPEDELVYWKPITYLQLETEKNEYNKTIRLIDSSQSDIAVDNLRTLLETD